VPVQWLRLPDRRYELAGRLLARSVEESAATGAPVREVLHCKAAELGAQLGEPDGTDLFGLLERYGFEPRHEADAIVLGNCPFHGLARAHTQTVCGMNLHLMRGILHGLDEQGYAACLSPSPGRCCVRLDPVA